jgi:hypothetical protein
LLGWAILGQALTTRLLTWDGVLAFFALGFVPSLLVALLAEGRAALGFFAAGGGLYAGLSQALGDSFAQVLVAPQAGAAYVEALLSYDQAAQVLTVGLPLALVIALFPYLPYTYAALLAWIGEPHKRHAERDAWHNLALLLLLGLGALMSVFALFSLHADPAWAIAWSAWGFGLFVAALALGRWARWGGVALLALGGLGVLGALAHDGRISLALAQRGGFPPLFHAEALLAALLVGGLLILAALGLWRRAVWSGVVWLVGLALSLLLLIFTPQASAALLALALFGFVVFALRPYWPELEVGRWRWWTPVQQASVTLQARQPASPAGSLQTVLNLGQMATMPHAANVTLPNAAYGLSTTLSSGSSLSADDEAPVAFDKAAPSQEPPRTQAYGMRRDPSPEPPPTQAKPPSIKFDLSGVGGPATELDPQSALSAPQSPPTQAKPPSIKFDLSSLQTKPAPPGDAEDTKDGDQPGRKPDEG